VAVEDDRARHSACSSPKTVFIKVDLPAPLGPMIDTISAGWTSIDTECRTTMSP
jgi:hypothetical protein